MRRSSGKQSNAIEACMIVKRFDTQFGTVQCAVSLFDSATVVARPALNESAQLGSSTILECCVPRCAGKNKKQ